MSRWHLLAVERQWQGCAGIVRHGHLIAQVGRCPGGGVNAHVAHAADDGQRLDAMPVQRVLEIGAEEGIDLVLRGLSFVRS